MFCGQESACGTTHAFDCGHCYEVACTGSEYQANACTGENVVVSVTNECPDVGHCDGQQNHFDLTTLAFERIANTGAGVISIDFRKVACDPGSENAKLIIKNGSSRWHLECAVKDLAGVGSVEQIAVNGVDLTAIYGQFWQRASDMGSGPYNFVITVEGGQTLETTIDSITPGDIDLGTNLS
jgi:expansin (peptidoglycan-binding protein)